MHKIPPLILIEKPYRNALVASKGNVTLYEYLVPAGFVAWLRRLAWTYFDNGYWRFRVDNMAFRNDDKIEYGIAPINQPLVFEPPILVKRKLQLTYYNNDFKDANVECLLDVAISPSRKDWHRTQHANKVIT